MLKTIFWGNGEKAYSSPLPASFHQLPLEKLLFQEFLLWHSGLRIQYCHRCGAGCRCSSDSIPSPGICICHGGSQKKKKNSQIMRKVKEIILFCIAVSFTYNLFRGSIKTETHANLHNSLNKNHFFSKIILYVGLRTPYTTCEGKKKSI